MKESPAQSCTLVIAACRISWLSAQHTTQKEVLCRVHGFRHLAREPAQYDFTLPMPRYCGGALLVTAAMYAVANGYSNGYWGWGGEDDDFCLRLMRQVHAFPAYRRM